MNEEIQVKNDKFLMLSGKKMYRFMFSHRIYHIQRYIYHPLARLSVSLRRINSKRPRLRQSNQG